MSLAAGRPEPARSFAKKESATNSGWRPTGLQTPHCPVRRSRPLELYPTRISAHEKHRTLRLLAYLRSLALPTSLAGHPALPRKASALRPESRSDCARKQLLFAMTLTDRRHWPLVDFAQTTRLVFGPISDAFAVWRKLWIIAPLGNSFRVATERRDQINPPAFPLRAEYELTAVRREGRLAVIGWVTSRRIGSPPATCCTHNSRLPSPLRSDA